MARTIDDAVREVCLALPEAEEFVSHGAPNFRVRGGRIFATYVVNHHGDGNVALWIKAPDGAQAAHVQAQPKHFFVPPYVGPSGWLGVRLDSGLSWNRIAALVRTAYAEIAKPALVARIGPLPKVRAPTAALAAARVDPMASKAAQAVLVKVRAIVAELPETSEATQYGHPVWRAGEKIFLAAAVRDERIRLSFHVGVAQQSLLTDDPRYTITPYIGHRGWIDLDVTRALDRNEVRGLAQESYRHFALRRMLVALDGPLPARDARRPAKRRARAEKN